MLHNGLHKACIKMLASTTFLQPKNDTVTVRFTHCWCLCLSNLTNTPLVYVCMCTPHRYPIITGRHVPTEWGLAIQRNITYGKVWLATKLLQLTGKSRYASSLMTSFKAFCVQNTIGYARSIISTVDNALELRDSIVPEERADWPCVWQQGSSPDWLDYACMCLTGEREGEGRHHRGPLWVCVGTCVCIVVRIWVCVCVCFQVG